MLDGLDVALQTQIFARGITHLSKTSLEGRVENALDETRLARSRNACDDGHHVKRNLNVDAPQVVHAGSADVDMAVPGTTALRHGDLFLVQQIFDGIAVGVGLQRLFVDIFRITIKDDFATQTASVGANVDEMVGGAHDLLIVFHDDNGIAQRLEFLQHVDQALGVARMQADTGFVEDVERAYKTAAQRGTEVDALALTTGERVGEAVEGEIAQTHIEQELQTAGNLRQ